MNINKLIKEIEGMKYDFTNKKGVMLFTKSDGSDDTLHQWIYNQALDDVIKKIKERLR